MGDKRVIKSETVSFVPGTAITWMYIAGISYTQTSKRFMTNVHKFVFDLKTVCKNLIWFLFRKCQKSNTVTSTIRANFDKGLNYALPCYVKFISYI